MSDFRKGFDGPSLSLSLPKLASLVTRTLILYYFKSFLTERSQIVHFESPYSKLADIGSGVIQRHVITALLFPLFISDACPLLQHGKYFHHAGGLKVGWFILTSCHRKHISVAIQEHINTVVEPVTEYS